MVGRTLGRYRVVEELGAGGMGAVYRAQDERLHRDVAVKVLTPNSFEDASARSRFRREALALSRMNHPNIAGIHDFDTLDGLDVLVMELVPGVTLSDRIKAQGGPLLEKDVVQLGKQLMQGLTAAHDAGIVHRDLKPANLRITPDGRLKILDFGLAKETHPVPQHQETALATREGQLLGTLPYMAPEQLRAERVDARTDLHAAGAVLYEMATGRRPFVSDSAGVLADLIMNHPAVPPRSLNGRLSPALEQVILKALEKDPDHRYQSAQEAAVDLERIAVGRVSAQTQTAAVPAVSGPSPGQRRVRPWLVGVSAAAVAAVGIVAAVWLNSPGPALAFAARDWILLTNVDNTTGDPVFDKSLDAALRVSLEQSMYANLFPATRVTEVLRRMQKDPAQVVDVTVGREICQRESLRALVAVTISQVGRQYALAARLIDPTSGNTVRSYAKNAATRDDVLTAVDAVASDLRRDLGESLEAIQQTTMPLPQATTASLDALKALAEARFLQSKGQEKEAVVMFQRALDLDPDFALAHAGIGGAYMTFVFNEPVRGREHLERAMKLRNRVTERERSIIELNYHTGLDHHDEAIQLFRIYLTKWPDDVRQRYNFGNALRDSGHYDEAIEQYRHAIRLAPDRGSAHVNLATTYFAKGQVRESIESWEGAFKVEPTWITNGNLNHEYGATLVAAGNIPKAREVFELALKDKNLRSAGLRSAALLDMFEGKYRFAQPKLEEAIVLNKAGRAGLSESRNDLILALVFAGLGDRAAALRTLDAAAALQGPGNVQVWLSARIGATYAALAAVPRASALLQLMRAAAADNVTDRASILWLEGEIALATGRGADAIEKLEVADKTQQTTFITVALARAYRATGATARAVEAYERLVNGPNPSCALWEATPLCLRSKYELATLYVEDKQPAKAKAQLDDLLALWKDADADFALLRDVSALRKKLGN